MSGITLTASDNTMGAGDDLTVADGVTIQSTTSSVALQEVQDEMRDIELGLPNLMAHGQSAQAIFGFPATATIGPEMRRRGLLIVLATLLMLAMSAWYRRVTHGIPR